MGWYFVFFLVSGFCSILYEIVWLRLSMAQFGVTSALVSIVLSMFMAGLGLGSWGSGYLLRRYETRFHLPALRLYALAELLIGVSAVLVPLELPWGRQLLERAGISSSGAYYFASAFCIGFTLVPWCACMGATIPLAMLAIRNRFPQESQRSFSYLYIANVLGAVLGATLPLVLIEIYGFHGTLRIGAALNGLLTLSAMVLSLRRAVAERGFSPHVGPTVPITFALPEGNRRLLTLLFATGLTSMGIEVVWIRQFTPYMGTAVYTFASILGLYLASTFVGSRIYRRQSIKQEDGRLVWMFLGLFALFPLITADPSFHFPKLLRLLLGIVPFSAALGFVTPMLVDRCSRGDPDKAGSAYAVNVLGCILGPLLSGFLLLPLISERWAVFIFSLPWLVLGLRPEWSRGREVEEPRPGRSGNVRYGVAALALMLLLVSRDYEARFAHPEVLRDNTATILAADDGSGKQLFVNGVGMTGLSIVTKTMAHLPLAFLDHPPQKTLVICFGMGTTYRSLISWGIPSTAVELVPSVPRMFWYFHSDGPEILRSRLSRVVIDDGRRYLERTTEQYDVITVDPPPPIQSAGSSLLYSKEFYLTAKQRLRPDGILQQWLPTGDAAVHASVTRALVESFPYVRVFHTVNPHAVNEWGFHFLASSRPLPQRTAGDLAQKMPPAAVKDLMEWSSQPNAEREFAAVLDNELSPDRLIAEAPHAPALVDDQPVNEYYLLRRKLTPKRWQ
jgi:spermidine synthase